MSELYRGYLDGRLKQQKFTRSYGEIDVVNAISDGGAKDKFRVLRLCKDKMYLYFCETDDEERFHIIKHIQYDYPSKGKSVSIEDALTNLPEQKDQALYIVGEDVNKDSVIDILKNKASSVVKFKENKDDAIRSKLKYIFSEVMSERIQTEYSVRFIDCFFEKKMIYVPIDDDCLKSTFWGKYKWRDIIPNEERDCTIANVDCKCLTIKIETDGFQNIFGKFTDLKGKSNYILLHETQLKEPQNASVTEPKEQEPTNEKTKLTPEKKDSKSKHSYIRLRDRKMSEAARQCTYFMFDTNVLLNDPEIITFIQNQKGKRLRIPLMVFIEINKFKDNPNCSQHSQAQIVYKKIRKESSSDTSIIEGVAEEDMNRYLPYECSFKRTPDDCIITLAIKYKLKGESICVITDDGGMQGIIRSLKTESQPLVLSLNEFYAK